MTALPREYQMSKKGNLASAMASFDKRPAEPPRPANPVPAEANESGSLPPSRIGKKALTAYFDPEVIKQLKLLAVAEEKTIQALVGEALNELFKKYGRPHIA